MKRNIIKLSLAFSIFTLLYFVQACKQDDKTFGSPTVSSFTPAIGGPVGTVVTIKGTYFSTGAINASPNIVMFNGVKATIVSTGTGSITAVVPEGSTSGKISVRVGDFTGSSVADFAVTAGTPAPYIASFTPITGNGVDNVSVTLTGLNFSTTPGNNTVKFNDLEADVTDASATSLTVIAPLGVRTGKITVAIQGVADIATSPSDFTVPTPAVTSFTPATSIIGSTVIITGTSFSLLTDENIVMFNGVEATVTAATATSLTVTVPNGATAGTISVTVDGLKGESKDSFTVKL